MKILELTIKDVRGIRDEISLNPEGDNIVIFGPNGTGKSAVVDAIDFLFTGNIQRLMGHGTRGMSLREHGSHIDAEADDAVVTAKIKVDGIDDPFVIKRCMDNPGSLEYPDGIDEDILNNVLNIAQKGQHVLSRTEILKFIAAKPSDRSQEIQALLDLSKVEYLRKAFVSIDTTSRRELDNANSAYEKSVASILSTIEIDKIADEEILKKINDCRGLLKGEPITELDHEKLQEGIDPRATDKKDRVYPEQLKKNVESVSVILTENGPKVYESEKALRSSIVDLKKDEQLLIDLKNKRLVDMGITLLDDSGSCPLCLKKWEPDELRKFLDSRSEKGVDAKKKGDEIKDYMRGIDADVSRLMGFIESLKADCEKLKKEDLSKLLEEWHGILNTWSKELKKPFEEYVTEEPEKAMEGFFYAEKWDEISKELLEVAQQLEKSDPEQKAWDTLSKLTGVLKRYLTEKKAKEDAEEFNKVASTLKALYVETKDAVLDRLYDTVNDDFTEYYKFLHCDDEDGFASCLKPDGAALDLEVDFYGRGMHHPRALHSEGHQDSMGLCLYLALNKKISEGLFNVIILDDVVMSIDSGHRKNICKLLTECFPEKQFVITTHNRTWAFQMEKNRIAPKGNLVEFRSWSVDTGPKYVHREEVWDKIYANLGANNIERAAHQLRKYLENYFENVCDTLEASVPYRRDQSYDLGSFASGAKSKFSKLISLARRSAISWDNEGAKKKFEEIQTQFSENVRRTEMEHWAVNAAVHYNSWEDFTKEDFQPVVEAFQDLVGLFQCNHCGGVINVAKEGFTPVAMKCPCGTINWNLAIKK